MHEHCTHIINCTLQGEKRSKKCNNSVLWAWRVWISTKILKITAFHQNTTNIPTIHPRTTVAAPEQLDEACPYFFLCWIRYFSPILWLGTYTGEYRGRHARVLNGGLRTGGDDRKEAGRGRRAEEQEEDPSEFKTDTCIFYYHAHATRKKKKQPITERLTAFKRVVLISLVHD